MANVDERDEAPARFADLLRVRAFRILFLAETQSLIGDQLARVALAALVLERTGSIGSSALSYALTYLPGILGGLLLARIGDRLPRLPLLVGVDLVRVVLFATIALPGTPVAAMFVLVSVATFVEPAFSAAQFAYLAAELSAPMLRAATALRMATLQVAQVGGFALGGIAVVAIGARHALLVDAGTFALSALMIVLGLRHHLRPRRVPVEATGEQLNRGAPSGNLRWLRDHGSVLLLVALICLVGLFVVPEGLAIPYAEQIGGTAADGGLLLACMPLGAAIGAVALSRWVPPRFRGWTAMWMSVLCGVPLIVTAAQPGLIVTLVAWTISGAMQAYQVEAVAQLAGRVPDGRRAGVMGVVGGCLIAAQGAGIAVFGVIGQWLNPGAAIAMAGAAGVMLALLCRAATVRETRFVGRHSATRPASRGMAKSEIISNDP